jgi:hypothetical protein
VGQKLKTNAHYIIYLHIFISWKKRGGSALIINFDLLHTSSDSFLILLALSTYIIQLCVERSRQTETKKRKGDIEISFWEEQEVILFIARNHG